MKFIILLLALSPSSFNFKHSLSWVFPRAEIKIKIFFHRKKSSGRHFDWNYFATNYEHCHFKIMWLNHRYYKRQSIRWTYIYFSFGFAHFKKFIECTDNPNPSYEKEAITKTVLRNYCFFFLERVKERQIIIF